MKPLLLGYRGTRPRLAPDVFVAPGAALIGDVAVGAGSSIWFGCVLRGDVCSVRVGERTNLQDGTIIHVTHTGLATVIGDEVTVGHRCLLHACTIEDRAFVGMGATAMDGSRICSGGMLAAGALLPPGKRVAPGELWGGVPARRLRALRPEETEVWSERVSHYVELAATYRAAEQRGGLD